MKAEDPKPVSAATASLPELQHNDRLTRLFAEHYRRILTAAYRITGNMADAEDVAQAVYLRLGAGEIQNMSNAGSYLYRAAINGSLDLLRRHRAAATEPLDSAAGMMAQEGQSPERDMTNAELGRLLRKAIGQLAPRAAEMFTLRYLEELDNREIAKLMGTSQAVVAVTLYQSRSKLKKRLVELQRRMQ